jgi:hypothetical protein
LRLSPLRRGPGPLFEQTWIPFTPLYPRIIYAKFWLKLACWLWRRFLKIFIVFLLFCDYLTLEKGNPLHLNNLESPSPKDDLWKVWLKLAQWLWRRNRKCKSLQTDDQNSSLKLSAQTS